MRRFGITARTTIIVVGVLTLASWTSASPRAVAGPTPATIEDTITIAVVGDLMCHESQFEDARTASGFDFHRAFAPIQRHLAEADLTFGNLETVTAGPDARFTGYPAFNTPVEYLDAVRDAGFDVLTTANNHSLDRGAVGIDRTLEALEARGLRHTGSSRTQQERDRPLIVEVKGLRLGVLAYTYGTNGIPMPAGRPFAVNLIDTLTMGRDIRRSREAGAEAIAVFLHWGNEYERQPNESQRRVAAFLARAGVQLVMGSHPHVLQPSAMLPGPGDGTFVLYSLGNFFSGQRQPFTDAGLIAKITLIRSRTEGTIRIGETGFVPTYVARRPYYRVVAAADALNATMAGAAAHPQYVGGEVERVRSVLRETTMHLARPGFTALPAR